jgi:hypothetical protein
MSLQCTLKCAPCGSQFGINGFCGHPVMVLDNMCWGTTQYLTSTQPECSWDMSGISVLQYLHCLLFSNIVLLVSGLSVVCYIKETSGISSWSYHMWMMLLDLMNILSASPQNIKISYGLCVLVCVTKAYMKLTERQSWYRKKEAYDNKNVFTGQFVQQYSLMKVQSVNYHKFVYTGFNCRDIEIIFIIVCYSYYYKCHIIWRLLFVCPSVFFFVCLSHLVCLFVCLLFVCLFVCFCVFFCFFTSWGPFFYPMWSHKIQLFKKIVVQLCLYLLNKLLN